MKIYLIAGHHNADPGAVNLKEKESDLTKELRGLISDEIRKIDPRVQIYLDYDGDTLSQVISEVDKSITKDDLLFDIHFNSFSNESATGSEVLVKNGTDRGRAATYSKLIADALGIKNRGPKTESESHRGKLAILHGKGERYLIEVCFMSNPDDMKKYHANKIELSEKLAIEIING